MAYKVTNLVRRELDLRGASPWDLDLNSQFPDPEPVGDIGALEHEYDWLSLSENDDARIKGVAMGSDLHVPGTFCRSPGFLNGAQ
jgi:hypothetical protein